MQKVSLIVAHDSKYGIGKDNQIPWHLVPDMKFFTKTTDNSYVIMGRKTWESIPEKSRGLKNRINVILSTSLTPEYIEKTNYNKVECILINSIAKFWDIYDYKHDIFVIGGVDLYKYFLTNSHLLKTIYITKINHHYNCDTFFPFEEFNDIILTRQIKVNLLEQNKNLDKLNNIEVYYTITEIILSNQEYNYLNLLKTILYTDPNGRIGRNGKTFSIFGPQLEFNLLNNTIPILTTKKIFIKGIFEELFFFIKGLTNSKILEEKKVNIWKDNTSLDFLKSRKLNYPEGDMGPMYGFQWRHFGSSYTNCLNNYTQQGYDQLYNLINNLINDPYSRRHLLTTYNPADVDKSVLAPCHGIVIQFYVEDKYLDCKMYQRSGDIFLGVPFNIASYSLLMFLIGKVVGLVPRNLIMTFGDVHIYEQHLEAVKEQIKRIPYEFPKINIKKELNGNTIEDRIKFMEEIIFDDIEIINYKYHPIIKAPMIA
jgi:dihydrofolate reductase/thymidylate synthase